MATFGDYLKKQRESKGLTQDKLAKSLNIPYTDVSKIERGRKKFPFTKLEDLALYFQLDFIKVKDLYVADILIEQVNKYDCSETVFSLAEKQVNYTKLQSVKQSKMDF